MKKRKKYTKKIRSFADDLDIYNAFLEKESFQNLGQESDSIEKKSSENSIKDRHGLPIIKNEIASVFGITQSDSEKDIKDISDQKLSIPKLSDKKNFSSTVPLKKRLKRYPPVEVQLDLHGFTALGAEIKARSFIQNCFQQGYFTLRIIVGKGLHSEAGAVLPHVIEELLTRMKKQGQVLAFSWEGNKKSVKKFVSGSIIVYLNQFGDEIFS